jgi:A1 cistron-splicing factor AAR2
MMNKESVIVFPEIPTAVDMGLNLMNFVTGENFRGISDVPPGLALIYYSTNPGCRQGFFKRLERGEICIREWDVQNEEIIAGLNYLMTEGSIRNLKAALLEGLLNHQLGPYSYNDHHVWKNLTNFIDDNLLLLRNVPEERTIITSDMAIDIENYSHQRRLNGKKSVNSSNEEIVHSHNITTVPIYSDINIIQSRIYEKYRDNPQMLSSINMDQTIIMEELIEQECQSSNCLLLGEIQLSFLIFICLHSLDAFHQWKKLLHLVCNSESYLCNHIEFTITFIRLFYHQLNFNPSNFFETEISKDNHLCLCFSGLFNTLDKLSTNRCDILTDENILETLQGK